MDSSAELLQKATVTLEKYRKNKTLVSPSDLAGKYKIPFQNLKKKLAGEISDYLKAYSLEQLQIKRDSFFDEFEKDVNRLFKNTDIGRRAGRAVFNDFDIAQVEQMAEELRIRVYKEAWEPYFQKHTCLYADADCFIQDNPHIPRIYNDLVDKFWNEDTGMWEKDEAATEPWLLIYIQGVDV